MAVHLRQPTISRSIKIAKTVAKIGAENPRATTSANGVIETTVKKKRWLITLRLDRPKCVNKRLVLSIAKP